MERVSSRMARLAAAADLVTPSEEEQGDLRDLSIESE